MKNNFSSSCGFDLDLSFVAFPIDQLEMSIDSQTRDLMNSLCLWKVEMTKWIDFMQINQNLICHQIVRNASKISLGLELTNDEKMSELNNAWLGKSTSTDVLSFPIIDESSTVPIHECIELGDIVISVPTAIRQAKENNVALSRELKWLASHGLLHLLGWEHADQSSLNQMLLTQEQLLDLSGILKE